MSDWVLIKYRPMSTVAIDNKKMVPFPKFAYFFEPPLKNPYQVEDSIDDLHENEQGGLGR